MCQQKILQIISRLRSSNSKNSTGSSQRPTQQVCKSKDNFCKYNLRHKMNTKTHQLNLKNKLYIENYTSIQRCWIWNTSLLETKRFDYKGKVFEKERDYKKVKRIFWNTLAIFDACLFFPCNEPDDSIYREIWRTQNFLKSMGLKLIESKDEFYFQLYFNCWLKLIT